jgi:flagellar hook-associated protein 3 FlgL
MRIATTTLYDRGLASINIAQDSLAIAQEQVSTGKRVNTAADDPIAATEILRTVSSLANNTQYIANQAAANNELGTTDSTLSQVTNLLQTVRTTLVSANNGSLSDSERASLSTGLKGQLDSLVALANTQDGNGNYLFSGYRTSTAPFANNGTSVSYAGDDGSRSIQVSATRQLAVSSSGADVFNRIPQGNGVFTTAAASANTGTGIIDTGTVANPAALTGHTYDVAFSVVNGATTYQVTDTTTNTPVGSATAFTTSGTSTISVAGMQFGISGSPADGDHFTLAPAGKQSMFQTLQNAIDLLAQPTTAAGGIAKLSSGLSSALSNIDNALDHTSSVRATVGVRQNELTALGTSSSTTDTDGQARLSTLQDTDYAKSVADLTKDQASLSAAEKVFATINAKSLFDYL